MSCCSFLSPESVFYLHLFLFSLSCWTCFSISLLHHFFFAIARRMRKHPTWQSHPLCLSCHPELIGMSCCSSPWPALCQVLFQNLIFRHSVFFFVMLNLFQHLILFFVFSSFCQALFQHLAKLKGFPLQTTPKKQTLRLFTKTFKSNKKETHSCFYLFRGSIEGVLFNPLKLKTLKRP